MTKILNTPVIGPVVGLCICLAVGFAFVVLLGGANIAGHIFYPKKTEN